MMFFSRKGERRLQLDSERIRDGEPRANFTRNRSLNCHFEKNAKAYRNKGRNRFKTGRKRQKSGH